MARGSLSFPWFGVLLIIVGSVLLVDRLVPIDLGYRPLIWTGVGLVGIVNAVRGFNRDSPGRIFWGTVLFLYGVYFFIQVLEIPNRGLHLFFPSTLIIIGAAFLMTYLNNIREWFLVVPGSLLAGLGAAMLLSRLGFYDWWRVWLPIRLYWPVILVITGTALLLSSRRKRSMGQ
jgi:hypothetical protein